MKVFSPTQLIVLCLSPGQPAPHGADSHIPNLAQGQRPADSVKLPLLAGVGSSSSSERLSLAAHSKLLAAHSKREHAQDHHDGETSDEEEKSYPLLGPAPKGSKQASARDNAPWWRAWLPKGKAQDPHWDLEAGHGGSSGSSSSDSGRGERREARSSNRGGRRRGRSGSPVLPRPPYFSSYSELDSAAGRVQQKNYDNALSAYHAAAAAHRYEQEKGSRRVMLACTAATLAMSTGSFCVQAYKMLQKRGSTYDADKHAGPGAEPRRERREFIDMYYVAHR